jgi:hypothetical protein
MEAVVACVHILVEFCCTDFKELSMNMNGVLLVICSRLLGTWTLPKKQKLAFLKLSKERIFLVYFKYYDFACIHKTKSNNNNSNKFLSTALKNFNNILKYNIVNTVSELCRIIEEVKNVMDLDPEEEKKKEQEEIENEEEAKKEQDEKWCNTSEQHRMPFCKP